VSLRAHVGRPLTVNNNLGGVGPWLDGPRVLRFAAVSWITMVVQTEELAASLQQFFPGAQLGSEVSFGLDLEISNRTKYEGAPGGGGNGGSAGGFATLAMLAGTSVTLRQRLLPSCCVDPACLRYRCATSKGGTGVCEGAARRNATYSCRAATDAMGRFGRDLSQMVPGLEFVTHILDADPATLGVAQEFTLAGYRQRSAVTLSATLPPLAEAAPLLGGSTSLLGDSSRESSLALAAATESLEDGALTAPPHSAAVHEGALRLPEGFVSNVSLFRGTFR